MREYILEKVNNTPRYFKNGNIEIEENEPVPESINMDAILKTLENHLPAHYFNGLKSIKIGLFI